jgi:hypothetical protein
MPLLIPINSNKNAKSKAASILMALSHRARRSRRLPNALVARSLESDQIAPRAVPVSRRFGKVERGSTFGGPQPAIAAMQQQAYIEKVKKNK